MVLWYKVKWIDPLFAAFNRIAPNRGHTQDGTIGDLAHAAGVSGHNPDDTAGVTAERQDADTRPEVRAADVDAHLNQPGVTMEDVVQATVAACRAGREARFIYIIYNRRIWSASAGWAERPYTGDDPHDQHAHFSGHPDADENGTAFTYIEALGDEMELSDKVGGTATTNATGGRTVEQVMGDQENMRNVEYGEIKSGDGRYPPAGSPFAKALAMPDQVTALVAKVDALQADINALQAGQVDQDVVNAAVATALAAQTPALVKAINDDAARRAAE
jgi:hypothetical protein